MTSEEALGIARSIMEMPRSFPVFNLGAPGETEYQTYHRGHADGWAACCCRIAEMLQTHAIIASIGEAQKEDK